MDGPEATGVVRTGRTPEVPLDVLRSARALMDQAFDDFTDDDWDHALGGWHAWVASDSGEVVAHGSVVPRTLWAGDEALAVGYVEAVAVLPALQRRGLGAAVMAALEERAMSYDLLALSSSESGRRFYDRRGWTPWAGPTGVRGADGFRRTPDEDGSVLVFAGRRSLGSLDLAAPLWCEPRVGDDW